MLISRADKDSLVDEDFAPERVIVDLRNGRYYCLNESAAFIWMALESEAKTLRRICVELSGGFSVQGIDVEGEVQAFVLKMKDADLLAVQESTPAVHEPAAVSVNLPQNSPSPWVEPIFTAYKDLQNLLVVDPIHDVDEEAGWPKIKNETPASSNE